MGAGDERFNLGSWLLDRNVAEGRGGRPAIRFGDTVLSYADVLEQTNRCGHALRELGADLECRVLIVLPDAPEFVAAWLGTLKIGSVFAMANTIHTAEDYAYYLDYTRAPVAVVHESVLDRIVPAAREAAHLRSLLVVRDGDAAGTPPTGGYSAPTLARADGRAIRVEEYDAFLARQPVRLETAPTGPDDIAGWLFTSGSTGKPKAAVHLHQDFRFNI